MSFVELETRLARLEERGIARDAAQARLEGKVDMMLEKLSKFTPCPAVGSCVPLAAEVKELSKRTASLEETRTEQKGAWKLAVVIGASLTTVGGIIGWIISQGWHSHTKP